MATIVKAANAAQFLSLVPRLLGCHVTDSLVLVPFEGPRTLGALRVDLPGEDAPDEVAATLLGMVCRIPTVDGVALVVYTDASCADGIPHRPLAEAVDRRADAFGLRMVDALCVAADGWGSYLDPGARAEIRPLTELGDAAPAGLDALPLPSAGPLTGVELPEVSAQEAADSAHALASFARAVQVLASTSDAADVGAFGEARPAGRVDPRALAAATLLDDLPVLFEDALSWDPAELDPHEGAALIWCLSRPSLRDIALVGWSGHPRDADEALQAQLGWERGEEYPPHLAMRMWGEGDRPEPERLHTALALVRSLAARTPSADRAGLLAMCGWLAWALGRSSQAAHYAALAHDIDPDHGLAGIIRSFVEAGHLPGWAFDRGDSARSALRGPRR